MVTGIDFEHPVVWRDLGSISPNGYVRDDY
ncbi:uncharacterized protein ARMOST_17658 [Armillaria ostoyae]|uniref:Uncharacterized protein n=1 Tax=Armillaria ostoyae TaxID=47428 RepID=A0A284RZL0_ARMOS|nr:uncharacterized protein ARMOST_17658 [Armillaria ostoyae]